MANGYIVNENGDPIEKAPIIRNPKKCPDEYLPQPLWELRNWLEKGTDTPEWLEAKLNELARNDYQWGLVDVGSNRLKRYELHHRMIRFVGNRRDEGERAIQAGDKGEFCPVATPDTEQVGRDLRLVYGAELSLDGKILSSEDNVLSLTALMIPFLHFNSAKRSVVACRMLWHAVEPTKGEEPRVKTGYESLVGFDTVGVNALTAFIPWRGHNYEDAIIVSESFAKRIGVKTGDKLTNRHGNKGVAVVLPEEEIPEVELPGDAGRKRLDLLINPCTIESRSNYGMLLEAHFSLAEGAWRQKVTRPFQFNEGDLKALRSDPGLAGTDGKFMAHLNGEDLGCWPAGYVYTYRLEETAEERLLIGSETMQRDTRGQPRPSDEERAIKVERRMVLALLARGCDALIGDLLGTDQNVTESGRRDLPATTSALLDYLRVLGIRVDFAPNRIQYDTLADDIFVLNDARTPDKKREIIRPGDLRDDQHPYGWRYIKLPFSIKGPIGEDLNYLPVLPYYYRPCYGKRDNDDLITQKYREVVSIVKDARETLDKLGQSDSDKELEALFEKVSSYPWVNKNTFLPINTKTLKTCLQKAVRYKINEVFKAVRRNIFEDDGLLQSAFGKRYDLSARAVGVPDPGLKLDEARVPSEVLKRLFPKGNAPEWVLVNRNPSISLTCALGFRVQEWDQSVIGLHPTVVGAFQGDFDGDEYNLFFPKSDEALAEVQNITMWDSLWKEIRGEEPKPVLTLKHELQGLKFNPRDSSDKIEDTIKKAFDRGPTPEGAEQFSKSIWEYFSPVARGLDAGAWYHDAEQARALMVRGKLHVGPASKAQELLAEALFDVEDRIGLRAAMVIGEKVNQECLSAKLSKGGNFLEVLRNGVLEELDEARRLMEKADIPQQCIDLVLNEIRSTGMGIEALALDTNRRSVLSVTSSWTGPAKRFQLLCDAAKRCHADRRYYDKYDVKAAIIAGAAARSVQQSGWIRPSRFVHESIPARKKDDFTIQFIQNPHNRSRYPIPVLMRRLKGRSEKVRERLSLLKRVFSCTNEELRTLRNLKARTPEREVGSIPWVVKKLKAEKSSTQRTTQK